MHFCRDGPFFHGSGCYENIWSIFSVSTDHFQADIINHIIPIISSSTKKKEEYLRSGWISTERRDSCRNIHKHVKVLKMIIITVAVFLNFTIHNNILYEFGVINIKLFPTMSQMRISSKALHMQLENLNIYSEI